MDLACLIQRPTSNETLATLKRPYIHDPTNTFMMRMLPEISALQATYVHSKASSPSRRTVPSNTDARRERREER